MKKESILWSILSIVMVVMLSIGVSSCSKDDDEGGSSSGSVGKFTYGSKSVRVDHGYYGTEPEYVTLRFYDIIPTSNVPNSFSYVDIDIRCPEGVGAEVPTGEFEYYTVVAGIGLTQKGKGDDREWVGEYWGTFGEIDVSNWKVVGKQNSKLIIKKNGSVYSISISDVAINNKVDGIIWGDDGYRTDIASFSYTGTLTFDEDL